MRAAIANLLLLVSLVAFSIAAPASVQRVGLRDAHKGPTESGGLVLLDFIAGLAAGLNRGGQQRAGYYEKSAPHELDKMSSKTSLISEIGGLRCIKCVPASQHISVSPRADIEWPWIDRIARAGVLLSSFTLGGSVGFIATYEYQIHH
ncbi:hypothetical protein V8E36_002239 [Tilletia maclaganii]